MFIYRDMLTEILKDDSSTNSAKQHLALLCLGEIGRRKDLSSHDHIENIVIESFHLLLKRSNLQPPTLLAILLLVTCSSICILFWTRLTINRKNSISCFILLNFKSLIFLWIKQSFRIRVLRRYLIYFLITVKARKRVFAM
ncbi:unnamed protein product [Prunus brigantina]